MRSAFGFRDPPGFSGPFVRLRVPWRISFFLSSGTMAMASDFWNCSHGRGFRPRPAPRKAAFARSCAEVLRSEGLLLLCDAFESQQRRGSDLEFLRRLFVFLPAFWWGKWAEAAPIFGVRGAILGGGVPFWGWVWVEKGGVPLVQMDGFHWFRLVLCPIFREARLFWLKDTYVDVSWFCRNSFLGWLKRKQRDTTHFGGPQDDTKRILVWVLRLFLFQDG